MSLTCVCLVFTAFCVSGWVLCCFCCLCLQSTQFFVHGMPQSSATSAACPVALVAFGSYVCLGLLCLCKSTSYPIFLAPHSRLQTPLPRCMCCLSLITCPALPSCLIIQTGNNFACVACACLCLQATKILDTRCQAHALDEIHRKKDNEENSPADIIHCYCCCGFWCFACLMCKVVCSGMLTGNSLNIEKEYYSICREAL